jgi:hypothetical protein
VAACCKSKAHPTNAGRITPKAVDTTDPAKPDRQRHAATDPAKQQRGIGDRRQCRQDRRRVRQHHAGFVPLALGRCPVKGMGLVHQPDRRSQDLSFIPTERLAEEGIEPSVRRVVDTWDNALTDAINCLFKAEVILPRGP